MPHMEANATTDNALVPDENNGSVPPEPVPSESIASTSDEPKDTAPAEASVVRKRSYDEMEGSGREVENDREEGLLCPVCLDAWTSVGPHRLCSLKCGHLFGLSCVVRWLGGKKRGCPTCNAAARKQDIREIYASKLVTLDTSELENLRVECVKLRNENHELQQQLSLQKAIVTYYKEQFERPEEERTVNVKPAAGAMLQTVNPRVVASVRLEEGSCRVLAHNAARDLLVVSQEHSGPLWPGFGVRRMTANTTQLSAHQLLHKKELRDLSFHPTNPDFLLSVGFDNSVKLLDLACNKVVFSWSGEHRAWSCCWDRERSEFAFVGTERGRVVRLDTVTGSAPHELPLGPVKPVAVIALRSSRRLGCIFACRLLSIVAYRPDGIDAFQLQILEEGKFAAMTFSEEEGMDPILVLACRPHEKNVRVRYLQYKLEVSAEGSIRHSLLNVIFGGDVSSQLSRPCLLPTPAGLLFFAFNETISMVCGWYLGEEKRVVAIKTHNFVRDLLAVTREGHPQLFILCPNILKCYELS